jgi:DNA-binding CsgD family transcriptional regulator
MVLLAYAKTGNKIIKYYLPFLISITFQLIFATVLQYQNANLPVHNSYPNVEAKYLYFLGESSIIFTLPLFCHKLFNVSYIKQRNLFFAILYAISLGIIFSPYFVKYIPQRLELTALPGLIIYRVFFFLTVTYSIFLLILHIRKLTDKLLRMFANLSLLFAVVSLVEILHCELFPVLKYLPLPIPLSPLGYFILNLIFMIFIVQRLFLAPAALIIHMLDAESYSVLVEQYKITDREKEIIGLLINGYQNKDICQKLYISESTVKTHIKNIYKKLGIQNRVQLVNSLKNIG